MSALAGRAIPTSVGSALSYIGGLLNEMGQKVQALPRNSQLTPAQWRKQVISNSDAGMYFF